MLTLDQFIQSPQGLPVYVREPGFMELHVRHGPRTFDQKRYENILDIALIEARYPGKGAFTNLFARLKKDYPTMGIYVECVHNKRFRRKLLELGFQTMENRPLCYLWLPKEPT